MIKTKEHLIFCSNKVTERTLLWEISYGVIIDFPQLFFTTIASKKRNSFYLVFFFLNREFLFSHESSRVHTFFDSEKLFLCPVQVNIYHQYDKIRAVLNLSTEDARAYVASSTQPSIRQQTMQYICK